VLGWGGGVGGVAGGLRRTNETKSTRKSNLRKKKNIPNESLAATAPPKTHLKSKDLQSKGEKKKVPKKTPWRITTRRTRRKFPHTTKSTTGGTTRPGLARTSF